MNFCKKVIRDTLMRKDAITGELVYSRTSLTMFTAWLAVLWSFHYALIKYGFNEVSFGIMVTAALGSKVTDSWSRRMNPETKPTNEITN